MLGMRNYTQEYIDTCRSRVASDVAAYRKLAAAMSTQPAAMDGFEATFFNNLIVVLEYSFVHRLRTVEGKDGNPLNEVRVLCDSMLQNGGVMSSDKLINLSPAKSALKHRVGDDIKLKEADFVLLAEAFFGEIERRYL